MGRTRVVLREGRQLSQVVLESSAVGVEWAGPPMGLGRSCPHRRRGTAAPEVEGAGVEEDADDLGPPVPSARRTARQR